MNSFLKASTLIFSIILFSGCASFSRTQTPSRNPSSTDSNIQDTDQYVLKYDPETGNWNLVTSTSDSLLSETENAVTHLFSGASGSNNFSANRLFYYGLDHITFNGKNYPVSGPGVYRVIDALKLTQNMIILPSKTSVNNPKELWYPLLQGLNAIHIHGPKHDDDLWHSEEKMDTVTSLLTQNAYTEATCGSTASMTMAYLAQELGFQTGAEMRFVRISTDHNINAYSDGHTIFELLDPITKKWVLVDEDLAYLFKDPSTHAMLNAWDVTNRFTQGEDVELSPIGKKNVAMAPSMPFNKTSDAAAMTMAKFSSLELTKLWYKRVFVLLAIDYDACGAQQKWERYC